MPNKVNIPKCVRCGKENLSMELRTTTVQFPDDSAIDNVPYKLCKKCFREHGSIIRIDRRKDQDNGYFSGDRHVIVPLKTRVDTRVEAGA